MTVAHKATNKATHKAFDVPETFSLFQYLAYRIGSRLRIVCYSEPIAERAIVSAQLSVRCSPVPSHPTRCYLPIAE